MMKPIKYLISMLALCFLAIGFAACGDEDEPQPATVSMAPGASPDIVVDYMATITPGKVMFIATGDWAAEIFPETRTNSHVDWIELSAYKGGEGNYSLQIFVTPNNSHDARYASIVVTSPTNSIKFQVTQKGRPEATGGDKPIPNPGQ